MSHYSIDRFAYLLLYSTASGCRPVSHEVAAIQYKKNVRRGLQLIHNVPIMHCGGAINVYEKTNAVCDAGRDFIRRWSKYSNDLKKSLQSK